MADHPAAVNGVVCSVPTAIAVTSSDLVLPPHDRQTPPAAVPSLDSLDGALMGMHTLIEQHGYVIALYPASTDPVVTRRLHTVRSVLESDRIALLAVDLPPLGLAVLAQQLRQLSICDFSPGVLASAARLLAHYIYAGALLDSVAKLDRVPVSLKSHAKSWVPGAQFAVLANPRAAARPGRATEELAGPEFATRLLVAQGQLPSDWVTATLAPAWRVQGSRARSAAGGVRALVGDREDRRVRRRAARRLRALPTRLLRTPRGVPLVRPRAHRRPLRILRRPASHRRDPRAAPRVPSGRQEPAAARPPEHQYDRARSLRTSTAPHVRPSRTARHASVPTPDRGCPRP